MLTLRDIGLQMDLHYLLCPFLCRFIMVVDMRRAPRDETTHAQLTMLFAAPAAITHRSCSLPAPALAGWYYSHPFLKIGDLPCPSARCTRRRMDSELDGEQMHELSRRIPGILENWAKRTDRLEDSTIDGDLLGDLWLDHL